MSGALALATLPLLEPVDTGIGGMWDEATSMFVVPFSDEQTAETVIRLLMGIARKVRDDQFFPIPESDYL